ncbi:MAG: hypothetical protein Q7U34_05705 [Anaerolineales bacterium]|nr:hypothetical protein [Anaerolineales bacterium]
MFHSGLKDGRAIQAGSSGQRLRRSKTGAFCQKWRDNTKESRQSRRCRSS